LGLEDNGQAVIGILHTCFVMAEKSLKAKCNVGFIFASDEETGSDFGLKAMVNAGIFSPKDEAVVPDFGSADGSFIEVAEKSVMWLKVTTIGKQAHASMPHLGINAGSVGSRFAIALEDMLKSNYTYQDPLFDPPYSTFEPTQKFNNVESTKVMPGKDEFTMDMRVMPKYSLDEILSRVEVLRAEFEKKYGVQINCEILTRADAAPPTSPDSTVAKTLMGILKDMGIDAKCGGIGGGTCGAILREINVPALVWSTLDELAHQPNEYTVIDNMLSDASAFLAVIGEYAK
jgi:succinyl-diaminopimelate desuccinylase